VKWVPLMSNQSQAFQKDEITCPSILLGIFRPQNCNSIHNWFLGLGFRVLFCCSDNVKVDPNHHQSIKRTDICWEFKPILLSSESWVYSPFTHGTSFSLSLCCLLLGSCALMHGSVACRVVFTWHWPWGEVTGRSRSLEGIGSRFSKPSFIT
jgi:hypothetical protein